MSQEPMFMISTNLAARYKHQDSQSKPSAQTGKSKESLLNLHSPIQKIEVIKGKKVNVKKFQNPKKKPESCGKGLEQPDVLAEKAGEKKLSLEDLESREQLESYEIAANTNRLTPSQQSSLS